MADPAVEAPLQRRRRPNPYSALIEAGGDDAAELQRLYADHRGRRAAEQRAVFLAPDFAGLVIDQHLLRLERPAVEPGFRDERNCLVFWARPPNHLLRLAARVQQMLCDTAPGVWLMPTYQMHLTVLEVAFSKTPDHIAALVAALRPALPTIASYTHSHRARLVKPSVSYDRSAFALSLLPASGEPSLSPAPTQPDAAPPPSDSYTYHHFRRDIFDLVNDAGLDVASRYLVPSAHITLGRFLDDADHDTPGKRRAWVQAVDRVNQWLEADVWDRQGADLVGEWIVGHEKGLDARSGTLWYGGGRTIIMGEGF